MYVGGRKHTGVPHATCGLRTHLVYCKFYIYLNILKIKQILNRIKICDIDRIYVSLVGMGL